METNDSVYSVMAASRPITAEEQAGDYNGGLIVRLRFNQFAALVNLAKVIPSGNDSSNDKLPCVG